MSYAEDMGHTLAGPEDDDVSEHTVADVRCKYCELPGLHWVCSGGTWRLHSAEGPHVCAGIAGRRGGAVKARHTPDRPVLYRVRTRDDNHVHLQGLNDSCFCGLEATGDESFGILEAVHSRGPVTCKQCLALIKIARALSAKDIP